MACVTSFVVLLVFYFNFVESSQLFQIQSVNQGAPKVIPTTPKSVGCLKKRFENQVLKNGALCINHKPIKPTKVFRMSKQLCAPGWTMCAFEDKFVQRLSWKPHKMPHGCFAIQYGESKWKAAGYGKTCHKNLYFDGILCCPKKGKKLTHKKDKGVLWDKKKLYLATNSIH